MRNAFRDALMQIKKVEDKLYLIVGDIGYGVFEDYSKKFKDNYLNIGICEANMIGFASGMSMNGFIPIAYTIVPFLIMRPFEQIRIDLALHNRKVILVGVGGGLSYGNLGPTHHSFEDLTLMTALPNFSVFTPSQPSQSSEALKQALECNGPSYIRLGKNGEPDLSKYLVSQRKNISFFCNDHSNSDILILTYGAITYECIKATLGISKKIKICVASVLKIKPLPDKIIELCLNSKNILIVEEGTDYHSPGTNIAARLMQLKYKGNLKIMGIKDKFTTDVGSREYLLKINMIDSKSIELKLLEMMK
jgi:transketolase